MIRNIQKKYFEVWGNEVAQNQILKGLLLILVTLLAIESVSLGVLGVKDPFVVSVSDEATKTLSPVPPSSELTANEVRRVMALYAKFHHEWEHSNIESRMKDAGKLVHPDYTKKFYKANEEQIRIAKNKKISQRFYFDSVTLNPDGKTAQISGDRILTLETLRAANPMTLEMGFALGQRTLSNPEGVYITSEKLIQGN